ncbi:MAG: MFS transporter [Rubrobacter sp.]
MNVRLLVLAVGTFAIGTGSFVFAGLLENVAEGVGVSVAAAGNLITIFAVTYAVAAPVLATLLATVPRRGLLLGAISLFTLANFASALAPNFELLMLFRVFAALGAAMFTPNAVAVASSLAPPEGRGRAISVITGGLTIAFVIGIPLGSLVGSYYGWRSTFVLVGVLALIAVIGVRFLPFLPAQPVVRLGERLGMLKRPEILATLSVMAFSMMGGFVAFTYLGPLLAGITSFGGAGVSLLLLIFGAAAMFGNSLGGYGADNFDYRRFVVGITVCQMAALLALSPLTANPGVTATVLLCVTLVVWGVSGFAFNPLQQHRMTRLAPEAENVAISLNSSSIYLGQGIGAGLGALVLSYGSLVYLGLFGAVATSGALITVLFLVGGEKT